MFLLSPSTTTHPLIEASLYSMSTMLDTFDAPMSDYTNDLDVLMQAHSSDPWPPLDDGVMEEDPLSSFQMVS